MTVHINPFLFEGEKLVRVLERASAPWFIAKDACDILSLGNVSMAVEKLDDDEKGISSIETLGGLQEVIVVSEGGLYTLILRSRQATTPGTVPHRFRKWVTGEVLPEIRKNGVYGGETVILPTPSEHRPFPEWPLDEMRTKRGVVDMYRMLYGPMAAQWISPQMGFPSPPLELVEHGRQYTMTLVPNGAAHG